MANSDALFDDFATAYAETNGVLLATTISPQPPHYDPGRLYDFRNSINQFSIRTDLQYKLQYNPNLTGKIDKKEAGAWLEVFTAYHKFIGSFLSTEESQNVGRSNEADWGKVYEDWKDVVNALFRGYQSSVFEAWTIPCLYVSGRYLRIFAIKADAAVASQRENGMAFGGVQEEDVFDPSNSSKMLEDAARQINRIFGLCIGDRNPEEDSRKWALYYIATLLFKTHFKLNHISLSKNILRSLRAATDMPPLARYPQGHQTSFLYYTGVIHFLDEDYQIAEEMLTHAYSLCHKGASRNIQLILTYLIPTKLLTSHKLPSSDLLSQYPALARLFQPVCDAIRKADLAAFTSAMEKGEEEFVKRRIYLTLERGQDVILRNIFRKIFLAGGFEAQKEGEPQTSPVRRTRISVDEFAAALKISGAEVSNGDGGIDYDEVECLIANAIYKNLMKGYIARDRRIVVLSKAGAFPGTGV